ncbi:hypothetical protein Tco_1580294, partial [Tanacetum coccineum]
TIVATSTTEAEYVAAASCCRQVIRGLHEGLEHDCSCEKVNSGIVNINSDLVKEIAGEDVSEADYAQRMVGLISQRRKLIAEQKAKAQRDKPMTQAQQRQYMATYLKNQARKRTGVELQTESSKKLKSDTREDVSVPKEKDKESDCKPESAKSGTKEDVEAYMEERVDEPSSKEFPMSSIPQGPALAKIVKWQIIKTGKRGAYQIIREDNTDVVYKAVKLASLHVRSYDLTCPPDKIV